MNEKEAAKLLRKLRYEKDFPYHLLHDYTEFLRETDDPTLTKYGIIWIMKIFYDEQIRIKRSLQSQIEDNKQRITQLEKKLSELESLNPNE